MEWVQVLTIVATMLAGVYAFYQITKQEISVVREQINKMDQNHRQDIRAMDEKWERMDIKWERLFEWLLLKEQNKN